MFSITYFPPLPPFHSLLHLQFSHPSSLPYYTPSSFPTSVFDSGEFHTVFRWQNLLFWRQWFMICLNFNWLQPTILYFTLYYLYYPPSHAICINLPLFLVLFFIHPSPFPICFCTSSCDLVKYIVMVMEFVILKTMNPATLCCSLYCSHSLPFISSLLTSLSPMSFLLSISSFLPPFPSALHPFESCAFCLNF